MPICKPSTSLRARRSIGCASPSKGASRINAADNRQYPAHPLLGVGALIFRDTEILLIERGKQPLKGFWSLPGGLVEVGEKLDAAVRREVQEETGLEIEPLSFFEIFERIIPCSDPASDGRTEYHYVLIDYLCKVTGGQLQAASDVSAVAWVTQRKLAEYRLTDGTQAVIERAFANIQF